MQICTLSHSVAQDHSSFSLEWLLFFANPLASQKAGISPKHIIFSALSIYFDRFHVELPHLLS